MSTVAEVRLWGRTIGAVALPGGSEVATFEYDRDFINSGIQVAPLMMPLAPPVYSFPALAQQTFHGLPGLLADSLPDKFGNALINTWLAAEGRTPGSFNAVERLCYTGTRGMGALEYRPTIGPRTKKASRIQIDRLVDLASEILSQRNGLKGSFGNKDTEEALKDILRVGTSAGGARAKAIIAWNPKTNEVRSGQVTADAGFEYWLLKFDGVSGNRDKELEDPKGYGTIEYAYYLMATAAGITMSDCRILIENGRHHFMTKRFDRLSSGEKLHMQSLGAIAHLDYNAAGAHSYEQALLIIRQLGMPMASIEEMFRRMVFNILARNQDDHVKNIAFLMDKRGEWSLSPAFDVTYSYQPSGIWTSSHQMTMNGKRDGFGLEDFRACAKTVSMKRGRAEAIVEEVRSVVRNWPGYAEKAGVSDAWAKAILGTLRLEIR
ncbi:type II toxin-antitoxin system HipA family toxin [Pelotalea chapellei]|uniref:HipA domain-containing protein n=1 Tax=Pelotalea chapellei TaxID=44671 RepID=A0ABS5U5M9_9BACT|nr:type II toxin-antitoxin system HipA family toxin [Pelotalea chapellei]MBT1070978.1 HipA domain-containing protein [Pelotalea chapellei]